MFNIFITTDRGRYEDAFEEGVAEVLALVDEDGTVSEVRIRGDRFTDRGIPAFYSGLISKL